MADSTRDIRAKTDAKIREYERKHQSDIRALESKYRSQMEALRAESERQQADCKRQIEALDAKMRAAIAAGQRDIIEQTKKQSAEQRKRLAEIERKAAENLKRCSEELRSEIDRRYRIVEAEIRRLFDAIASQDEKERLCAERALRKAEEVYAQLMASEVVAEFRQGMLEPLRDVYSRLDGLCKQRIWSAVGSTALALELDCVVTTLEAEERLQAWTSKNDTLLKQIAGLQSQLSATRAEAWHFEHWQLDYTCALLGWNQTGFEEIEKQLAALEEELKARHPRCSTTRMSDISLEIGQEELLLDAAMEAAHQHVASFLMMAQLMAGLTEEVTMASSVWTLCEEAQLVPIDNTGTMVFRRTDGSMGELRITVREQRTMGNGLMMTMLYDGTRSQDARSRELHHICTWLAHELIDMRYGGVVLGTPSRFLDGNIVGMNIPVGDMHVSRGVLMGEEPTHHDDPETARDPGKNKRGAAEV